MKGIKYFYISVIFATYSMILFNGFYYLLLWNFDIFIKVADDVLIKGFLIGFTGALACDKLDVAGFIPFGWFGALAGLQLADFIFMLVTPYGSYWEEGVNYVLEINLHMALGLVVGTVIYYVLVNLTKIRRLMEVIK
jgi:hypothetical protein